MTGGRWVWTCRFMPGVRGSSPGRKAMIGVAMTSARRSHRHPSDTPRHQPRCRRVAPNPDRKRRPSTHDAVAARTGRKFPPTLVAALLDRNDQRRAGRTQAWRRHSAQTRARDARWCIAGRMCTKQVYWCTAPLVVTAVNSRAHVDAPSIAWRNGVRIEPQ